MLSGRDLPQWLWIGLLLGPCAGVPAVPAAAAEPVQVTRSEPELTRTQATELVQKRYDARVVRASSSDEDGRRVYVFKLLSNAGKVWFVRIDARSGAEVP
jgi:uncharacterized membrane protein YkoI